MPLSVTTTALVLTTCLSCSLVVFPLPCKSSSLYRVKRHTWLLNINLFFLPISQANCTLSYSSYWCQAACRA
jgi:hypothetical protein